jgi:hypothetical protein
MEKPSCSDFQTLDARRGNGLGPQEDAGEGLGVNESPSIGVETDDGNLGVSDVSSDVAVENDLATDERIWDIGFVVAGNTVPPREP